ncbi:hypothetical protein PFLUV_G00164560 [Perca fluviatilis]|uniref:Uncharacterized protein n=1 Tax=Perca fluviatilis TaxID=8168 RepID=A0A6A5EWR2_PERFL|nr:hypothetical protein PFLUV_G00164560 [Perca fluviatilis]
MYVCVLLNATCCYIMYSNSHNRSVIFWPVYSAVLYDKFRFLVEDWFLFCFSGCILSHTLTVRQGDPEQSCLFFSVSFSLFSLCLRNYSVHHIVLCLADVSSEQSHIHATLKMSSELQVGVGTVLCLSVDPLMMRHLNGRDGGHCFTLKLSKCIHPSFSSFSQTHTRTHTHTPNAEKERERDRSIIAVTRCVSPLQLPIISKNKPSVSHPEPIRSETEAHRPIGEAVAFAAIPVTNC